MAADARVVFPTLADNVHLREIAALFGGVAVPPGALPPHLHILFLCFTNRSGSNYLADALHATGRLNLAGELLNHDQVAADARLHGHAGFAAFLAAQMGWRMVDGRFAVKIAPAHLELLGRAGVLDLCRDSARYVFIERGDRLGQAISAEIAWQTGQWSSRDTVEMAPDRLRFDRDRIAARIAAFAEDNRIWDVFFGRNGIVPVHVLYEDLVADPARAVRAVGAALGIEGLAFDPARVTLRRQAGALNASWRAR
ncbi:MAG TPA: Stf0 family sulfotransferase, partial [Acetobacteraceae bacterium]|nr:Stf0 family sulfotransferase [Acetobacteraceae bacterium]